MSSKKKAHEGNSVKKILEKYGQECKRLAHEYGKKSRNPEDDDSWQKFLVYSNLTILYKSTLLNLEELDDLNSALMKLPKRTEFDEIRGIVEQSKRRMDKVIKPLAEEYKEFQERSKRGANIYG